MVCIRRRAATWGRDWPHWRAKGQDQPTAARIRRAAANGDPARLIAAGFPDRIAQRRGESGSFRLAGGGGAKLPLADSLARWKEPLAADRLGDSCERLPLQIPSNSAVER